MQNKVIYDNVEKDRREFYADSKMTGWQTSTGVKYESVKGKCQPFGYYKEKVK